MNDASLPVIISSYVLYDIIMFIIKPFPVSKPYLANHGQLDKYCALKHSDHALRNKKRSQNGPICGTILAPLISKWSRFS